TIGNLDLETVEVTPEGGTLTVIGSIKASQSTSTILERLDLANGTHTFEVIDNSGVPFELDIPGVIPNGGIIKTGSGQMRLGAANTRAGGIRVQSGLVAVGNDGALGMGSVVLQGGALAADGGSRTVANPITIGAGTSGFTSSFDLRLTGTISNSVAATITKSGAGILTFSGPQS